MSNIINLSKYDLIITLNSDRPREKTWIVVCWMNWRAFTHFNYNSFKYNIQSSSFSLTCGLAVCWNSLYVKSWGLKCDLQIFGQKWQFIHITLSRSTFLNHLKAKDGCVTPLNYPWVIISDNIDMKISKDEYQTSCLLLTSCYLNCMCMPSLIYYNKQAIYVMCYCISNFDGEKVLIHISIYYGYYNIYL